MKFIDVLFWIMLVVSLILVIWNVFGDSPTEFLALATLTVMVLLKVSSISDRVTKIETKFNYLTKDFKKHIQHK